MGGREDLSLNVYKKVLTPHMLYIACISEICKNLTDCHIKANVTETTPAVPSSVKIKGKDPV